MTQMKSASATTDPIATTTGTTTPAGTDPIGPFSHTNTSAAAPSSVGPVQSPPLVHMSSPPHKPRFTRSPTPYTLQDMDRDMDKDMDGSGDSHQSRSSLQRSSPAATEGKINLIPNSISNSTSSSTTSQHSSNSSTSNSGMKNYTYLDNNNNSNHSSNGSNGMTAAGQHSPSSSLNTIPPSSNNNNNDYKKPTAGWTLFAQLAKMTPEEVELIRLTKANTAANKQICAAPVTLFPPAVVQSNSSSSSSSSNTGSSETLSSIMSSSTNSTMEATLPNSSPKRTRQRRKELSLSPPPMSLSVVSETSTHDRQHSLMPSSSSPSSEGDKSPDSRSSPSTNERGSLSPPSESSPSSPFSSVPSPQSSPSPESSPRRRKKSKLDHPPSSMPPSALWSSQRRKSSLSPPKSVQIDESKNMVFSYQSGSTIEAFLPTATTNNRLSTRHVPDRDTDDSEDYIPRADEETFNRHSTRDVSDWDLSYLGYAGYKNEFLSEKNFSNTTASTSPPSSTSSPWWSLSSAAAATSPNSNQSGYVENNKKSSSSSSTLSPSPSSWTPEAGGSLYSVLSDNGPNTFANIASSLDTLWSPPMLRRTFSEVSSARRGPRSSLSVTNSPAGAAGTGEGKESGARRIPVLRRQASIPSLEHEMSEESPFFEQPPVWSPVLSQPQESVAKIVSANEVKEPMDATDILAVQGSTTTAESENKEVVMMEVEPEVPADTLTAPETLTTPASGSTKGSRGAIRRRDARQLHHPYRRRVPGTTASQDGSVDDSILRLPAQFRRSASFSGTTSTPPVQPALRREASTTAYMDIL